jgi:hypothetical protein
LIDADPRVLAHAQPLEEQEGGGAEGNRDGIREEDEIWLQLYRNMLKMTMMEMGLMTK